MEAPSVHALERDEVAAGVSHGDGNRDPRLFRLRDSGIGYLLGPGVGEALGVGDEHRRILARCDFLR